MAEWFDEEGLVSDSAPNVSAQENAGNPHYLPDGIGSRPIRATSCVLLDLWGKLNRPGRGVRRHHLGRLHRRRCPRPHDARALRAVAAARDAGIALVQSRRPRR